MGEQFNYNIVLIGFMGVGKSTISEFLKTSFAMEVIEMDQIIAEREGIWRPIFLSKCSQKLM